jgi:Domain of unknown function (DUF6378)
MISRLGTRILLEEVANLIDGERAQSYGEPQESFDTIASLWTTYLFAQGLLEADECLNALIVADLMILLKVARNSGPRKTKDNYLDICGYGGLAGSHFVDVSKGDKSD